jgi:hypothetical protein
VDSLVFTLIGALPVLIIVFLIIGISKTKKIYTEKEGADMFKQLYVYLVMFTMLILSVGGGIGVIMGVADLINPTAYTQSYTDYKNSQVNYDESGKEIKPNRTEEQMRKDYQEQIKFEKEQAKNEAKNTIIDSIGFIVIPLPIFLFFNRMRKKKENE